MIFYCHLVSTPARRLAGVILLAVSLMGLLMASPTVFAQSGSESKLPISESVRTDSEYKTAQDSDPLPEVAVPRPSERTLRHHRSGNLLWVINVVWGLCVPALILYTGLSARVRNFARKTGRWWYPTILIYLIVYLLLTYLLELPLSYYEGFVREHDYGLSNQSGAQWFGDSTKSLLVALIISSLFLWVPYLLLKRSPRRWWLYAALATVPVSLFVMLIAPIWITPLFDEFGPMSDKALEADILQLAHCAGIEEARVFEVNKSEDTKKLNAYVSGLLGTQRIALWDTLLEKLNREQVLTVMGHEMGHYILGHVWNRLVLYAALSFLTLYCLHLAANALVRRYHMLFGFKDLSDIASLPLFVLLISAFSLLVTPIVYAYSRHIEHEADRFALEITRDNHAYAGAFVVLQQENLVNPNPSLLYKLWWAPHPVLADRISFANSYQPWKTGQKSKYDSLFSVPVNSIQRP